MRQMNAVSLAMCSLSVAVRPMPMPQLQQRTGVSCERVCQAHALDPSSKQELVCSACFSARPTPWSQLLKEDERPERLHTACSRPQAHKCGHTFRKIGRVATEDMRFKYWSEASPPRKVSSAFTNCIALLCGLGGRLAGWRLAGWLAGWVAGWLAGWLVGWLTSASVHVCVCSCLCLSVPVSLCRCASPRLGVSVPRPPYSL